MPARSLTCLLLLMLWCSSQPLSAASPPHVLILLADDLGYADVGFNGGKEIKTPHLDNLASSGARLTQFYVQPVCSPTRAALMTGRYPMRYGLQVGVVRPWAQYGLPLEERLLSQALQTVGYTTAIVGKWHLGTVTRDYLPTHRGFNHQYGHYLGAIDYYTHQRDGGFDWHRDDQVNRDEGYSTHLIASETVRIIRNHPAEKLLFLYVPFNAVHSPHQVPSKYKEPYDGLKEPRRTYAGMVAAMDEAIGRILEALDEAKMRDNTLILFSSDNGGPAPGRVTDNGKFRAGKGTLYEGGVRVAACAAWHGRIRPGTTVDEPIHIVDLYPTLLNLAGASVDPSVQPLALDGLDIWPVLAEGKPSPRHEILLNSTPESGAIRVGDWKLKTNKPPVSQRRRNQPKTELYNLAEDPREENNLASSHPDKVEELQSRYDQLAAEAAPPKNAPKPNGFQTPKIWGE